jgi:hypothetical protein
MPRSQRRSPLCLSATVALSLGAFSVRTTSQGASGPFDFLAPSIVLSARDRAALDGDQVVARVLPARAGS